MPIHATFSPSTVVHESFNGQHAWFSSVLNAQRGVLIVAMSLGGDGTPCPPPGKPPQNCTMAQLSRDNGVSWTPFEDWSKSGANEVEGLASQNGSYFTFPYSVTVDYTTNKSATSVDHVAHVDKTANRVVFDSHYTSTWEAGDEVEWPDRLVHSGSVVRLSDDSYLTTMYGHGAGVYRNWTKKSAVYFMRATADADGVPRTWKQLSEIPWRSEYGDHADGPGEPSTARLASGRLMCIFRSDARQYYYAATSDSDGRTWTEPTPLGSWSVKPRLRVMRQTGIVVLTGGRPGINLWASADEGVSWERFNLAKVHNGLVANTSLQYDAQVVNASGPRDHTALPTPQTSSYTGLVEADDGALVVSYDRIANGWHGPPGAWGAADTLFTVRVSLSKS